MKSKDFLIVPATTLAVMFLNVLVSFGVVWIYSLFVPGLSESDYRAFAMKSAPVSSVVAGIPLMMLAGYLLAKGRPKREALVVAGAMALLYVAVDGTIIAMAGVGASAWKWEALSYPTKLLSALAGAALRSRST